MSLAISPAVMNAACSVAKTVDDVKALAATSIGAITVGSITIAPRDGNPEPRWFVGDGYALNSFGMPNGGADFYKQYLPEMIAIAHTAHKKLSLSIAGFTTSEYAALAELADDAGVDYIELNLGCPNVAIDGQQKPIASFDTDYIQEIITAVKEVTAQPLLVKVSPYSNPAELKNVARVLATHTIAAVVTSNTFPNGYETRDGQSIMAMNFGGVSGRAVRAINVGQAKQFRDALPPEITVIGVGGIESASDVAQYQAAGAEIVQAATLIVRDGHRAIERLVVS